MPGRYSFPRRERLTRTAEFQEVYRRGFKRVGREFICYTTRREGQGRKLGISVSRKIGKAVVRNRIKRYIREIYRTHRPWLADDAQVVLVARPPAATLSYRECRDAIRKLLSDGRVLHA